MVRPRTGLSAPSQITLCYLRQLVFPSCAGGVFDYDISNYCLRAPTRKFGWVPSLLVDGGPRPRLPRPARRKDPHKSETAATTPITENAAEISASVNTKSRDRPELPRGNHSPGKFQRRPLRDRLPPNECQKWYNDFVRLWRTGQLAKAKEIFFAARDNRIDEGLVQIAGRQLMEIYNSKAKHAEAPQIFAHMVIFRDFVTTRSLNCCLEAYIIRKNYPLFMRTFKHYARMNIVQPDHKTYELFIRCIMKTSTVQGARDILMGLEEERAPLSVSSWAAFLGGAREKNASLAELEQDFNYMRRKKNNKLPPALYNIMIEEALEYGKPAIAKRFVDLMTQDGVKPNEKTCAAFLRIQAKSGDWEGVTKAMNLARRKGMVFTSWTLNQLLDNYADLQQLEGLESLFDELCKEAAFPTPASFNIMIRTHIAALDEQGIFKWVAKMREAKLEPTAATFNTFFQDLRCDNVPRSLMYRVYNTVFNMDRNKVDEISRDILFRAVWPLQEHIKAPPHEQEHEELSIPQTSKGSKPVSREMKAALKAGAVRDALNIFREASSQVPITWEVIQPLARAYMLVPDTQINLPATLPKRHDRAEAIREAVAGLMISSVLSEAMKSPVVYGALLEIIFGLYKFMEANDIAISHNITYQTGMALINLRDPIGALYIMNEVSKTRWGRLAGWDIAGFTVLARAYLIMNDLPGVVWVVGQLIESREVPDDRFFDYLTRGLKSSAAPEFRQGIAGLIEVCKAHKGRLWTNLHSRANKVVHVMNIERNWNPQPPSVRLS